MLKAAEIIMPIEALIHDSKGIIVPRSNATSPSDGQLVPGMLSNRTLFFVAHESLNEA